jgi:hypothetical protein
MGVQYALHLCHLLRCAKHTRNNEEMICAAQRGRIDHFPKQFSGRGVQRGMAAGGSTYEYLVTVR